TRAPPSRRAPRSTTARSERPSGSRRGVAAAHGKRDGEAGPTGARLDANRPAVVGDDAVDERQPQPRPLILGGEEGVEDWQVFGEAGTVVLDVDGHGALGVAGAEDQAPTPRVHRLDRVAGQVEQDLAQAFGVTRRRTGGGGCLD